jgi:hypothetical protein
MFQALVKTLSSVIVSLYVPSLTTSVMMYGPYHGGESLWWSLLP